MEVLEDHPFAFAIEKGLVQFIAIDGFVQGFADFDIHQRALRINPAFGRVGRIVEPTTMHCQECPEARKLPLNHFVAATLLDLSLKVTREGSDLDFARQKRRHTRGCLALKTELELWEIGRATPVRVGNTLVANVLTKSALLELIRACTRVRLSVHCRGAPGVELRLTAHLHAALRLGEGTQKACIGTSQTEDDLVVVNNLDVLYRVSPVARLAMGRVRLRQVLPGKDDILSGEVA